VKLILPAAAAIAALSLSACSVVQEESSLDGGWELAGDESRVIFSTTKAGEIAEAHKFAEISGTVASNGAVALSIPLASVDTGIDVRNERMREFLFEIASYPNASITAQLDPAEFANLKSGDSVAVPVEASVDLHGQKELVTLDLTVSRMGEDKVKVETTAPVIIDAGTFGLSDGVEKLRELANLDGIADQVPVSVSLVFTR
jgi:polyisoprenoid-binding protein YceI